MNDIAGVKPVEFLRQVVIQMIFVMNLVRVAEAQVYVPVFKEVEMQATIAPLGQVVTGNFSGHSTVAAICKVEKAIYFFDPDSMENLILTNVVSLPDTPIAISIGHEVVLDSSIHEKPFDKLAVLTNEHSVVLVSFGKDGRPVITSPTPVDAYTTDVRVADLEAGGKLDIVAFGKFCLGISVAKSVDGGRFEEANLAQGPLGSIPFSSIVFTDFNGDLVPDMAALDWVNRRLLIFYGRGDGTFAQPVSFELKAEPSCLAVADLTGNGYPDILIGYSRLGQIDLYGGDGVGRFFLRQTLKTVGPVSKIAVADFTGNGVMDIAALSGKEKQITIFSYDLISKNFKYAGVIGLGENYDDIIPFYFPDRVRADLVATSLTEQYIKVFKTSVNFNKFPDVLLPVSEDADRLLVSGNDTSSYVIVADSSGNITSIHYNGASATEPGTIDEFQSEGSPVSMKLIASDSLHLLLSYDNADMVSTYGISSEEEERKVMTAYLPFAVNGTTRGDSTIIVAAYPMKSDSEVGISYFTSFIRGGDFLEKDFTVDELKDYLSSAVSLDGPSFYRIWRNAADTLTFACTYLKDGKSVSTSMRGSDARLSTSDEQVHLLLESDDTLTGFKAALEKPMHLSLHQTWVMPFDRSDLSSIRVSTVDSTDYVAFFDGTRSSVLFYSATTIRSRLIRSWHVESKPADIAILPSMRRVYFLNRIESYVSIHSF